jgi:hypothetical protein
MDKGHLPVQKPEWLCSSYEGVKNELAGRGLFAGSIKSLSPSHLLRGAT